MMNWAGITKDMRIKLWTYAVNNATQHDVILTMRYRNRNPYKLFWGVQPNYIGNLKRWGETGIVKSITMETW